MGFIREGTIATVEWNADEQSFVRGEASSGVVVPLLLDLQSRLLTFQLFPSVVKPMTVTSNLAALLNEQGAHRWSLNLVSHRTTFDSWRQTVHGVSKSRFRLEYPNPNWTGRGKLEDLIDGLEAHSVTLAARASEGHSLDTASEWFVQSMDHVRGGYGRADLTGIDSASGKTSTFVQAADGGSVPVVDVVPASSDQFEVSFEDLRESQARLNESQAPDIVFVDDEAHDEEER